VRMAGIARQHLLVHAHPVSVTRTTACLASLSVDTDTRVRPPGPVNLAEFCRRLPTICASRFESVDKHRLGVEQARGVPGYSRTGGDGHPLYAAQFVEFQSLSLQWDLVARNPRHVEQIVDQAGELADLSADHRWARCACAPPGTAWSRI